MLFVASCILVTFYLYGTAISIKKTDPKLSHDSYSAHHQHTVEFIDVNGLNEVIAEEFRVEKIGEGFGFLEAPIWIRGKVLFTELFKDTIWKFDPVTNEFTNVATFEGCGPSGIGWNVKFPNELWISCWIGGSILKLNRKTYVIEKEYTYNDYADHDDIPFMADDVIIDRDGNVYFTDMPVKPYREIPAKSTKKGGVYMIGRSNLNEIKLVELLGYGPNGIAFSKDREQSIIAASNCVDLPLGEFDYDKLGEQRRDLSKLYIRGYKRNDNNKPFMYFEPHSSKFSKYFTYDGKYDYIFDSSAFDYNGNFWQATFLQNRENGEIEGGQASIFRNNINGDNPQYIGSIRMHKNEMAFSNFQVGADGYMYATAGDFVNHSGTLLRIKLTKHKSPKVKTEL